MNYQLNNIIEVKGTFTNSSGTLTDATTVICRVNKPDGTTTNYTYGVDASLVKVSTGIYTLNITANQSGTWRFRWYSSGNLTASKDGDFQVSTQSF